MHRLILLLLACCLIAGCIQSGGGEQAKPLPVTPGSGSPVIYEYTPEVEKQSYRPGEQVVVHWKATQAPVTNATVVPTVILEAFLYGPFASKEEASKVTGKDKGGTIKASAQVITVDATNPNPPDSAFTVPTSLPKGTYFVAERITTKANNTENTLEASGAMVTVP